MAIQLHPPVLKAGQTNIGNLLNSAAKANTGKIALVDGDRTQTYEVFNERTNRVANFLLSQGIKEQQCICILAQNCAEYVELILGAAKAGVIVSALNWRLIDRELQHCVSLVEPSMVFVDSQLAENIDRIDIGGARRIVIGEEYETHLARADTCMPDVDVDQEDGLLILYTSGTTGLPKGALISHRALIARGLAFASFFGAANNTNFVAWTPMFHMTSADQMIASLLCGDTVYSVNGYDVDRLAELLETITMRWLPLVPGMVGDFIARLKERNIKIKGVEHIGAMADLVPRHEIIEATTLFNAPFCNTFAATETGIHPASFSLIPVGEGPERLPKAQTPFADLQLVDEEGNEVPVGTPGEVSIAGPTVFSGYWKNDKANETDFRGGRFRTGDLLRRNSDGTLEFVDRAKYMIKSGGENIYPAEIELVVHGNEKIETAVIVRKPDDKWGEIPVLFAVRRDKTLEAGELLEYCKKDLSKYKLPREIHFVQDDQLPRSTTGKIQRHVLEKMLEGTSET